MAGTTRKTGSKCGGSFRATLRLRFVEVASIKRLGLSWEQIAEVFESDPILSGRSGVTWKTEYCRAKKSGLVPSASSPEVLEHSEVIRKRVSSGTLTGASILSLIRDYPGFVSGNAPKIDLPCLAGRNGESHTVLAPFESLEQCSEKREATSADLAPIAPSPVVRSHQLAASAAGMSSSFPRPAKTETKAETAIRKLEAHQRLSADELSSIGFALTGQLAPIARYLDKAPAPLEEALRRCVFELDMVADKASLNHLSGRTGIGRFVDMRRNGEAASYQEALDRLASAAG